MNVTLLTGQLSERAGGLYRAIIDLGTALSDELALNVTVKCLADPSTPISSRFGSLKVDTFESSRFFGRFGLSQRLRSALLKEITDVLHLHGLWTYPSLLCNEWHAVTNRPYIVSPHGMLDSWALERSRAKKFVASFFYQRKCLARAACIHALNMQELEAIRDFGVRNPVLVQPNGVDALATDALERANCERRLFKHRSMLFLARLHPKKRVVELLEGWHLAKKRGIPGDWVLTICGWDEQGYRTQVIRKIRERKLEGSVRIIRGVSGDEKRVLLTTAHAFVLPSLSEGLPIGVLEAWAHGVPVIMTPQCNLPSGFSEGAAFQCSSDSESIANAIVSMISLTDSERQLMGARGHELVRRDYSRMNAARSFLAAFQWVLGHRGLPENVFA